MSSSSRNICTVFGLSWMDSVSVTCIKHLNLAGDAGAVVIHGGHLNRVAVAACEGVEAIGEVRRLVADVSLIALCCHCVS